MEKPGKKRGDLARVGAERTRLAEDQRQVAEIPARTTDLVAGLVAGMRLVGRAR